MLIEQQKIPEEFFSSAFLADDLFSGLSADADALLRGGAEDKQFAENETIFATGEMPGGIYVLLEGAAEILYNGGKPVHSVRRHEILGLTEAVANLPYKISAKAVSECRFECIPRDALLAFLQSEPKVCFRLLQLLGTNLHKVYQLFH
jgi:CRP-like cAMP-binding protein